MAGDIAQAFVRIRPNTTGFKSETEAGIKGAFAGIGKLIGATFVVGGLAEATSAVAKAAADQQAQLAVVRHGIEQTNSAWVLNGKTVTQVLEDQARATGFTVAELAGSFNRIQFATKNTAVSFKILTAAEDIARAQHRTTAVVALALVRAYEGSSQSLRRFGLVIPPVTAAQDKLTKAHLEAIKAGAKFTPALNAIYKQELQAAKAADTQASSQNILNVALARFGGQAGVFAKTAAGQFARLHETVNQFEVALGEHLLPTLNDAAVELQHFFNAARTNKALGNDLASIGDNIKAAFIVAKGVIQAIVPPIQTVAEGLQSIDRIVGTGGILVAVAGFKTLGVAIKVVEGAQARYASVLAAGGAAAAAQNAQVALGTGTYAKSTTAVGANTFAVNANAVALAKDVDAMIAAEAAAAKMVLAQQALAAKYIETNVLAHDGSFMIVDQGNKVVSTTGKLAAYRTEVEKTGSKLSQLGRGLFNLAGGFQTLAAVGIAAAVYGIYRLVTADSALETANKKVIASERNLDAQLAARGSRTKQIAAIKGQLPQDAIAISQAKLAAATAATTFATSKAAKGSLEHQQNLISLAQAIVGVHTAVAQQKADLVTLDRLQGNQTAGNRKIARALAEQADAYLEVSKRAKQAAVDAATGGRRLNLGQADPAALAADRAKRFADSVAKDADKQQNTTLRHNEKLIAELARQTKTVPGQKTIKFILDNTQVKATLPQLLRRLTEVSLTAAIKSRDEGSKVGRAFDQGWAQGITDYKGIVAAAINSVGTAVFQAGRDAIGAHSPSQVARTEIGHAIGEGIALGILDKNGAVIGAVKNQLNDAIQAGVASVQQAIISAKQNLNSIGGQLAGDITNAGGVGGIPTGPAATQLARLQKAIAAGGASPETFRAAAALQNQAQAQQNAAAAAGQGVQRRLADLTDQLNRGSIPSLKVFNERLKTILGQSGVNINRVQRTQGIAAADQLRADIKGLKDQAAAILASPKFGGAGLEAQIVRPLDQIKIEQQNIADAAKAQRDAMIAEQKKAAAELKKHTKLLEKIHAQQLASSSLTQTDRAILKKFGLTPKQIDQYSSYRDHATQKTSN